MIVKEVEVGLVCQNLDASKTKTKTIWSSKFINKPINQSFISISFQSSRVVARNVENPQTTRTSSDFECNKFWVKL